MKLKKSTQSMVFCPTGMHVKRHCTEFTSTSCASCTEGTFQDGDNGREQCFSCKHCDPGLGLKVKKSCSSTSDAECEVLDGFFCSDSNGGGCRAAQRRTVCRPGQYIGQRVDSQKHILNYNSPCPCSFLELAPNKCGEGTADKDTECLQCTHGKFSNGTSSSCQNHKKCESVGLKLMRPGNDSTDSECGEHGPQTGLVPGIILVILVMALIIFAIIQRKKKAFLYRRHVKQKGIADYKPVPASDRPEPIRDQHQQAITVPNKPMDDLEGDKSPGPVPPSSPTHNGSVTVSVLQEDHQPVLIKRDSGASQSTPISLGPPSPSQSSLHSLGPPSTSRSASRSYVRSKSVPSHFKFQSPKLTSDRVSLVMDYDIAEKYC
ncbi:tumor necrosis factor receptor superfamily member 14-like isoform X2 [Gadus macrocephalus]|uniref:tumor necrosis factor receptor superfamily member 14-like isoform X2 n=1 Tax=Gadus macrocephalus TaxID=80720 RepID=UPI0028CB3035|nr:tumor necrosis factor receptor superfamily member 14-like isoform X2 [Gadus macrocephalus]